MFVLDVVAETANNAVAKAFAETIVSLFTSLYYSVAQVYEFMITMMNTTQISDFSIDSITSSIYTLVGVFMLFRITISAINYLINPDSVSGGKGTSAGSLIMRVIISLVLLMTLDSFIYPLLTDLQDILINPEDGIIMNLFDNISVVNAVNKTTSFTNKFFDINNVNAASSSVTCYYYTEQKMGSGISTNVSQNAYAKLTFEWDSPSKLTVTSSSAAIETYGSTKMRILGIPNLKVLSGSGTVARGTCPVEIYSASDSSFLTNGGTIYFYPTSNPYIIFKGGYQKSDLDKLLSAREERINETGVNESQTVGDTVVENDLGVGSDWNKLEGTSGMDFSKKIAKQFVYKVEGTDDETYDIIVENMIQSNSGNQALVNGVKKGTVSIDFLLGIITAIGLIVYIILLVIDVIIRNLKLAVLKMIAPVAVVMYIDPKDKIFNSWLKAFISAYVDLFIKLLAISLVVKLIPIFATTNTSGLGFLVYIFALFTFAKMLPNYISKIFGLDNFGGSMKEIAGGLKAAATTTTGAAVGGAVGFATGFGTGGGLGTALSGMAGGALKGLKSGAKGDIMGGASKQRARNVQVRGANASGGSAAGRLKAGVARFFGQQDAYEKAEATNKATNDTMSLVDKYKDEAEKGMLKLANDTVNGGADSVFGKLAQAKNELNHAQVTGGDVNTAMANYKKAQKDALGVYNQLLRGHNYEVKDSNGQVLKTYETSATLQNDHRENVERLEAVDISIKNLGVTDQTGKVFTEYSSESEDAIKLTREQSKKDMEKTRADHVIANNK